MQKLFEIHPVTVTTDKERDCCKRMREMLLMMEIERDPESEREREREKERERESFYRCFLMVVMKSKDRNKNRLC